MNAAYCYRSCRLRILWYENVTGKKGPGRFYSAVRTLEKLDKQYSRLMPVFRRITGRTE